MNSTFQANPEIGLSVFFAFNDEFTPDELIVSFEQLLEEACNGHRKREVNLKLIQTQVFGQFAHERYIRFDRHVLHVGTGLDVIDGSFTSKFSFKGLEVNGREVMQEIETPLKAAMGEARTL